MFLFIVSLFILGSSSVQDEDSYKDQQADFSKEDICKAAISSMMGHPVSIINHDGNSGDSIFVSYNRPNDGTHWAQRCIVRTSEVIWGTKTGRWRIDALDSKITYKTKGDNLHITISHSDGSVSRKQFYITEFGKQPVGDKKSYRKDTVTSITYNFDEKHLCVGSVSVLENINISKIKVDRYVKDSYVNVSYLDALKKGGNGFNYTCVIGEGFVYAIKSLFSGEVLVEKNNIDIGKDSKIVYWESFNGENAGVKFTYRKDGIDVNSIFIKSNDLESSVSYSFISL